MIVGGFQLIYYHIYTIQWTPNQHFLPIIMTTIYKDFSKILFEYENSYHRDWEVGLKNQNLNPRLSKIDKGKYSVSQA